MEYSEMCLQNINIKCHTETFLWSPEQIDKVMVISKVDLLYHLLTYCIEIHFYRKMCPNRGHVYTMAKFGDDYQIRSGCMVRQTLRLTHKPRDRSFSKHTFHSWKLLKIADGLTCHNRRYMAFLSVATGITGRSMGNNIALNQLWNGDVLCKKDISLLLLHRGR